LFRTQKIAFEITIQSFLEISDTTALYITSSNVLFAYDFRLIPALIEIEDLGFYIFAVG
jgi:hypothetical protein